MCVCVLVSVPVCACVNEFMKLKCIEAHAREK